MVGILVVTHGDFSKSLVSSSELIMGARENVDYLGLYHGDNTEDLKDKIKEKILELSTLNENREVLVFVDMLGGSPSNSTMLAIHELNGDATVECITGINLPTLLEITVASENLNVKELRDLTLKMGPETIVSLNTMFNI